MSTVATARPMLNRTFGDFNHGPFSVSMVMARTTKEREELERELGRIRIPEDFTGHILQSRGADSCVLPHLEWSLETLYERKPKYFENFEDFRKQHVGALSFALKRGVSLVGICASYDLRSRSFTDCEQYIRRTMHHAGRPARAIHIALAAVIQSEKYPGRPTVPPFARLRFKDHYGEKPYRVITRDLTRDLKQRIAMHFTPHGNSFKIRFATERISEMAHIEEWESDAYHQNVSNDDYHPTKNFLVLPVIEHSSSLSSV